MDSMFIYIYKSDKTLFVTNPSNFFIHAEALAASLLIQRIARQDHQAGRSLLQRLAFALSTQSGGVPA